MCTSLATVRYNLYNLVFRRIAGIYREQHPVHRNIRTSFEDNKARLVICGHARESAGRLDLSHCTQLSKNKKTLVQSAVALSR